ncbi:CG8273 [Drosophila busckii]|uniref:CG8273 n=1 Tax=Drosophila busckii TaxID=30019 RepID=A0A0M4F3Q9_DROBS|nr:protein SON [Drosophila busckii]ALC45895.1 CG8273 [Drosophila busckii]
MTEKTENAASLEKQEQSQQSQLVSQSVPAAKSLIANVKREKIDTEIEAKLKALNVKESLQNSLSQAVHGLENDTGSSSNSNDNGSSHDDKKQIEHVKSSNEILAELFGVFNVAPPEELLDDKNLLKKNKRIRREKNKKSRYSKISKSDEEVFHSEGVVSEGKLEHKHKRKKHKHKHKDSKEKHKNKDREKSDYKSKDTDNESEAKERKGRDRKRSAPMEAFNISSPVKKKTQSDLIECRIGQRIHKSLCSDRNKEDESTHTNKNINGRATRVKRERRQSDELSLSDEETYLRQKANGRRLFYKDDTSSTRQSSHARYQNNFIHRSRSRSRSRDLGIDKKRLLEIARRNAISMFKLGNMAGISEMTPEVKDKVLLKMRYGGRTVQDLTDFCKKISNGEMLSDLSSDDDSDVDKNGNAKAFHHPFQLKEREPIVMHIRNSTPLLPSARQEDQAKAITMQFPVSSGQVHRMNEAWVPVESKNQLAPLPSLPPAKQATNMFKDVQRNVFAKLIPQQQQQEPAFKPAGAPLDPSAGIESNSSACSIPSVISAPMSGSAPVAEPPTPTLPLVLPDPRPLSFVAEVPIPSISVTSSSASIFPEVPSPAMDVSAIITQRLSAIRRLQTNPTDPEALKMMYNAQRDMTSWASSKHLPGQFTGSTGAQVMKVHELNSGPQLWARRDQLTSTKPVTGGMGMALLQKMGWKPGEGLGRTKTGSLQPLQLTVKLDKRGLVSREDRKQQSARQATQWGPGGGHIFKTKKDIYESHVTLNTLDKHPVCVLNELTSKNKWTPPQYTLKEDSGPAHSRLFLFSVEINGQAYTPPQGCNTKKEAKLNAAKMCLQSLGILPPI